MKTCIKCLLLYFPVFIISSCKKEYSIQPPAVDAVRELSPYQSRVASLTKEVAQILESVYQDAAAIEEVNGAIKCGYYLDERVLLKDLLVPEQSALYKCDPFLKLHVDTGRFRRKFCEIVEHGNFPLVSGELNPIYSRKITGQRFSQSAVLDSVPTLLSSFPISIYFPYSENFLLGETGDTLPANGTLTSMLKPTIVYTDRDADSGPGKKPTYCLNGSTNLCYTDVTVNDDYAELHPTHIVAVGATVNTETKIFYLKTEVVTRVYNGWSRLTKQMDKLISFTGNGGGSEIKVCRINGYLKVQDEQISNFTGDVTTVYYTRADIRKKRFKRIYSVWDPNWNYQDIEQIYAVYEDDNIGSKTFTGSLNTTLNLPGKIGKVEGEIGFKIGITTQDEILTQRKLDRKSFLRDGMNNQGYGFMLDAFDFLPTGKDWPIFDGGAVWSYTLPYRIY